MYPDFSYLFEALTGMRPGWMSIIKTFGLFLALTFVVGGLILVAELKRKEAEGLLQGRTVKQWFGKPATIWEILGNALIGFILGAKGFYAFFNFAEMQANAASVLLSLKGHLLGGLAMGAFFGFLKYYEKKREQLPEPQLRNVHIRPYENAGNLVVWAAITGIIGAKIFTVIETPAELIKDPIRMLFSGSGLAIYGGLIGAFIGMPFIIKRMGLKAIHIMDAAAPTLALGYGIGRMGCHLSGDGDWGIPSNLADRPNWLSWLPDWTWTHHYPRNVLNEGTGVVQDCVGDYCSYLEPGVYPTSVYEVIMTWIIFAILWWVLRKRIKVAGVLFFVYLIFNGFERFWIEKIRVNPQYEKFGLEFSQAEVIAVCFMIVGVIGAIWLTRRHKAGKPVMF